MNHWACKCRVRRDELFDHAHDAASNDGDAPSDAGAAAGGLDEGAERELRSRLNAQLSGLLDFDIAPVPAPAAAPAPADQAGGAEDADEEEFEFRLFRDDAPGESHKVVIQQNDDVAQGEGAFVVPRRPDAYYVAGAPDAAALQRFRHAAVEPDHILADAERRRCWGLERPWRVVRVGVSGKVLRGLMDGSSPSTKEEDDAETKKKRRPGKKRRIVLRTRAKAEKEKAEAARKFLEGKEEHLKAKKQRLNREKKLKRRAKDKEKKAAAGGVAASDAGDVSMADHTSNDGSAA